MATIIDSLVIELGLDPSKFTQGQKEAIDALRKMQEETEKSAKKIKGGFADIDNILSKVTTSMLKFGAAALGARGIAELVTNLTRMNTEIGRSAELIGTSSEELSKWEGIAARAGGSAQEMRETFGTITRNISQVNVTGPNTDFFQWLRKLGVNYRQFIDQKGQVNNMTGLLEAISGGMQTLPPGERQLASQALGLGTQNTLLFGQGPQQIQQMLEDQKRINVVTEQQTENARKLNSQWEELKQSITNAANALYDGFHGAMSGALEDANVLMDLINNHDKRALDRYLSPWSDTGYGPGEEPARGLRPFRRSGGPRRTGEQFGPFQPQTELTPNVRPGANLPLGLYAAAASLANIPGFEVTGGRDAYHNKFKSQHNEGLALDFTIGNAANAAKIETMINAKFKELGIDAAALNEYDPAKRSAGWTGPHMHLGFKSQDALRQFNEAKAAGKIDFHIDNLNVTANDPKGLANGVMGAPRVNSAVQNRSSAANANAGQQ